MAFEQPRQHALDLGCTLTNHRANTQHRAAAEFCDDERAAAERRDRPSEPGAVDRPDGAQHVPGDARTVATTTPRIQSIQSTQVGGGRVPRQTRDHLAQPPQAPIRVPLVQHPQGRPLQCRRRLAPTAWFRARLQFAVLLARHGTTAAGPAEAQSRCRFSSASPPGRAAAPPLRPEPARAGSDARARRSAAGARPPARMPRRAAAVARPASAACCRRSLRAPACADWRTASVRCRAVHTPRAPTARR